MAFGVGSGTQTPSLYQQTTAPNAIAAFEPSVQNPNAQVQIYPIPQVGDLWVDLASNLLKRCSSVNPFTWVSVEGGGPSVSFADEEVPTGNIDGINVTYTLAFSPNPAASLLLTKNGVIQQQGVGKDYTISGATITMAAAPVAGDILLAWYRH